MHTSNEDILNGKERSNTSNIGTTKVNIEDFHSRNHYTYDENRIYMHLDKLSSSNDEKETSVTRKRRLEIPDHNYCKKSKSVHSHLKNDLQILLEKNLFGEFKYEKH